MKRINHIASKKFVKYAKKNLALIMKKIIKKIIEYEIIVITLVNIEALLVIFVI